MASPAAGGTSIEVIAVDVDFPQEELTMPANTDVQVTLVNQGVLQHNWVVEGTDVATDTLNGGESQTITVNLPAGEYRYVCTVPGHIQQGMVGTLFVQ